MLNIQTQHKFKYAYQQILFFELLFNVKLIYSIKVLGPWLWGNRPFFFFSVGQRKGPSGPNAPPVHGIKKCLGACFELPRLTDYQVAPQNKRKRLRCLIFLLVWASIPINWPRCTDLVFWYPRTLAKTSQLVHCHW